jgi:high-affinity iron transporter
MKLHTLAISILVCVQFGLPFAARADSDAVLTIWRLLDYMAIDYGGAVHDGAVVSSDEYAEMVEFAASVKEKLDTLPPSPEKTALEKQAAELQSAIGRKAASGTVATLSRSLAAALIKAYPVPLAPAGVPDVERGRALYAENCASCHGSAGNGKGPAAAELKPPPIAFTDKDRASERSLFALYQVISQGLDGTSMASFAHLPSQDRWALAFYVGSFAYPAEDASKGEKLWRANADLRRGTTLESLVAQRPAALAAVLGADAADNITAYLRRNPAAIVPPASAAFAVARSRLSQAIQAYDKGDRNAASDLALSAYLDGFEPVEKVLAVHDADLMRGIEGAMGELRATIKRGATAQELQAQVKALDALFSDAEAALDPQRATASSSFFGAFTVLLREALEAMLIVIVMLTLLRKAERRDAEPYIHFGWVSALAVGALTWAAATYLIAISGAHRELTEGFGSLFAAVILVWVGIWMHGKSQADAWQRYIHDKLGRALSRGSAWGLFGLTFIVVYREVFETILFYAAIWNEENAGAVLAGAGTAVVVLAGIAWALMRYGRALPVGKFFAYSSALLAIICVVLAGKGVSALQEAGWMPVSPISSYIRVELLGIYPTTQSILAQAAIAVILLAGFWHNRHRHAAG